MTDISKRIKSLRLRNGFTQTDIAEICNVSRQAVAKWEAAVNLPDIEKIIQLSELYHISTDELFTGTTTAVKSLEDTVRKNRTTENEKIINQALAKSITCKNLDEGIKSFLSYIGEQIGFDRIHIFESNTDGNYRDTYEWCNKGIDSQKEYLQCIPNEDMSVWLRDFSTAGHVFIENIEDIAYAEPAVYRWLKPQGVKSILAYPLFNGRCFIGVDNPAPAFVTQTSTLIEIMTHFLEYMLQQRDLVKELKLTRSQNNQISMFNNALSYRVDLVSGRIEYDRELAKNAGYNIEPASLNEVKKLCEQHREFYDHAMIDGFERAIGSKENVTVEFVSYIDDIHLRWNRLTISPFLDSKGKVLQLYGILQDISDSHKFIEQYNKYVLNLKGGFHVCYLSRPVHLEYVSPNLSNFLGYTQEEFERIAGTRYTNIMVEEDRHIFRSYYKRLTEKPGIESCRYRLIKKDGTTVSVIDTMESVVDSSGIIYGYAYILPETEYHVLLEMKEENEKIHLAQLNQQYEVFETLGKEYPDVYRVWLDEDKVQIVRLDGYITKGLDRTSSEYIPYYRTCIQYIQDRVHPEDRQKMLDATHPDTVRKAFEKSDEYTVIYRGLEKGKTHYYQLRYSRLHDKEHMNSIDFVAGFKNVDRLIEEEHANNKKLQDKVDIINTILQPFTCGYYMEYATDTFYELSNSNENMSKLVGKTGRLSENRERMKDAFPDKKAFKELYDFLNADTVKEHIGDNKFVTTQLEIKGFGWFELYMFIVDYEKNGNVAHSILLAKDITMERKHEMELRQQSADADYYDELTGAMNRNAYERDFSSMNALLPVGFIYCDANNLKQENERQELNGGDRSLVKFSNLLHKFISGDCIYRTGGDEFVCMIKKIDKQKFAERVTKIREAISENNCRASIGSAYGFTSQKESLIREAEIQMHSMKMGL